MTTITFFVTADNSFSGPSAWVQNQGAACTTASLLIALGLLGVPDLPALGPATLALGAAQEYGAPGLLDYVGLPWRLRSRGAFVHDVGTGRRTVSPA